MGRVSGGGGDDVDGVRRGRGWRVGERGGVKEGGGGQGR